jgi:hypothetical protein
MPLDLAIPAALAVAAAVAAAPVPSTAPGGIGLPRVQLGMSLDTWKALPFPGKSTARIEPVCADDGADPAGGSLVRTTDRRPGTVICAYLGRYGRFTVPEPIELGPRLQARRMRFTFVQGRLTSIEYHVSTDVFDDLTNRLTQRYGQPTKMVRDSVRTEAGAFPRVRESWKTPRGVVQVTDPVKPFNELSVRLSTTAVGAGRAS